MAQNPLASGFPNSLPIDPDGNLALEWRAFFQSLYTRTGGAPGVAAGPDLTVALTAEIGARIAGDAGLTTALTNETATRASADTLLSSQIVDEAAKRMAADAVAASNGTSNLNGAIASEQAARIIGDAVLAADIAAIRQLALLVNGDVPVGIMCNPDGTPIYVPV